MNLKANVALYELGLRYHEAIPSKEIDHILITNGFKTLEFGIYCGRDGRIIEQVGDNVWLTLTWHKMEISGRYEIVAYLSRNPRNRLGAAEQNGGKL